MDCLANIKFLDALNQPINGLVHQLWIGSILISDHVTSTSGESVWIKRPVGTIIDVRVKSLTSGEYKSKVKIQLIGEKTIFIVRSPKVLLKGVKLSAKDVATGTYVRSTYIVAEGDYLGRIADDNHTTINELIRINNLESDSDIRPGQILKIPIKKTEAQTPLSEVGLSSEKLGQTQKLKVYDRQVVSIVKKTQILKNKEEEKPVTLPKVTQDASKNKEKAPIVKIESKVQATSKVSQRNEKAIARLHSQVRGLIRKFINDVYLKHQIQLVIVQDYRTYEQQDALYAKGRTTSGRIVTKAKGGQSNHNFALAVDIFPLWADGKLHMDAKSDAENIKILKKVAPIGKSIGLEWGGDWKSITDNPHFQLKTGKTMSQLRQLTKDAGGDPLKVKYDVK